jgi:hypothetical protein
MPNEFIIKINSDSQGNHVSLDSMTIEASDALILFHKTLNDFAKLHHDSADVKVSLRDGCIESSLVYPQNNTKISEEITDVIHGNSENNELIKLLKDIQNKVKANGLDYSILHNYNNQFEDITPFFKARNFSYRRGPRKEWIETVIFLEGKLFEAGGKTKTNIHIEYNNQEYKIECSQEEAKKINERLYETVFLCVLKKQKAGQRDVFHFIDSYLKVETYNELKSLYETLNDNDSLERFDLLHNKIVEIIENIEHPYGELLKLMRLFSNPQCDRGLLRTVLMALKPIKDNNEKVSQMYTTLAEILRAGNKHKVI